jgi:hypothetical protein
MNLKRKDSHPNFLRQPKHILPFDFEIWRDKEYSAIKIENVTIPKTDNPW